jgi:bifunctional UDP-N-acetylglucosamine pyrophosphorylase/glucosamine-1-phosphate N-acetyltransferase
MSQSPFAAVILAAGSGTRMKSAMPKAMHPVAGRPMIAYPLEALRPLSPAATLVVIGPRMESVAASVAPAESVVQDPPLGTGDAVRTAMRALDGRLAPQGPIEDVLVLYGDTPFLATETLSRLLTERRRTAAAVLVSGMRPADPNPYGRFVLASDGALERIVEAADAGPEEQAIGLVNGGIMVIEASRLAEFLDALDSDNAKREFYLTDVVAIARRKGLACRAVELPAEELLGVNTRAELAEAEALMQRRLRRAAMDSGVTLIAPETVFLSADTGLGRDVVVEPNVTFGPGVRVGERARICSFSYLEGAAVGEGARVGPFARLRPGAVLEEEVHVGNFVEVKAARLGAGAKANHLSYIGDSDIGARTNIGAGTITCNYDGVNKSRTIIGEGAFIGSNTALVAPVTVGDRAIVAAGSVIVRDVPADALSIARGQQVDKPGRAAEIRARLRRKN